jgi:hypothetical protein
MKNSIIILTLFSLLFQTSLYSQSSNDILVLTKKSNSKRKIIKQNSEITIWVDENDTTKQYKGRFTVKNDEMISINNKSFNVTEIDQISSTKTSRITGGILLGAGTTILVSGASIIYAGLNNGEWEGLFLAVLIGLPATAAGIIMDSAGIIFLLTQKTYDTREGWNIQITP